MNSTKYDKFIDDLKQGLSSNEDILDIISEYGIFFELEDSCKAREVIVSDAIESYFSKVTLKFPYDYDILKSEIIYTINNFISLDNSVSKHEKYKTIKKLEFQEVAQILTHLFVFKNVLRDSHADLDTTDLMYFTEHGWYEQADSLIKSVARSLNSSLSNRDVQEIISILQVLSGEPVKEEMNENWVFLRNGIFDYDYYEANQKLIPYSKDIIAVNPLAVDFNPSATNPKFKFGNVVFDFEKWILEIADGSNGVKESLLDVLSALVYHNRKYKKAVMLYSPQGNNGKGTFLELCRNIIGKSNCADLAIHQFSDKSLVLKLLSSRFVAGDENPVDYYIDNSTNFKNSVTGDPISIDRKYKNAITFSFRGLIVQCMNGLPTTKDKTDSFYRRLYLLPFNNCFNGIADENIKQVYLANKDVLEYVVYNALMRNVKVLEESDSAKALLQSYKEDNDTMLQWYKDEIEVNPFVWDKIPWALLYGSYKWWCRGNTVRGDVNLSKQKFKQEFLLKILPLMDGWIEPPNGVFKVASSWTSPEPLIGKYDIDELKNPSYKGSDWDLIGSNSGQYKSTYRGIVKVSDIEE